MVASLARPGLFPTIRVQAKKAEVAKTEAGMIRVSVLYPNSEGARFDMDYWCNKHMPWVQEKCGEAVKGLTMDAGLAGGHSGEPPTYVAMAHWLFDSVESFWAAFEPHADEIMSDIPNYTDIAPVMQISDVKA